MHRINNNYSDAKYVIMALYEQCQLHSAGPYIPRQITNLMVIIIIIIQRSIEPLPVAYGITAAQDFVAVSLLLIISIYDVTILEEI